jgi:hypothetical protein
MNHFSMERAGTDQYFKNKSRNRDTTNKRGWQTVFYASSGNDTMPMVIFHYGAPGSWYELRKLSRRIASGFENNMNCCRHTRMKIWVGKPVTSIEEQSAMLRLFLN